MHSHKASHRRLRLTVRGAVQGVGFRPFVYRLACEHELAGWIQNSPQGVHIEVEGSIDALESFLRQLELDPLPLGAVQSIERTELDLAGHSGFEIRDSTTDGAPVALIMPDLATCCECRRELFDPLDRRYRYPFLNCTHCGPRFSIVDRVPYDRVNTTMQRFDLCESCQREYTDPRDRRFHAQPIACPRCGPSLELWDCKGKVLADGDHALTQCAVAIRQGGIVAIKGLGGFQILADARNEEALSRLRTRKQREEKPFALMYPSLQAAALHAEIGPLEARLLDSPQAPIVLLRRQHSANVAAAVAPGNPYLGVMLPYTPLHHLLMAKLDFPIVATSGNRADEPICTDEHDALARLAEIVDLLLTHNRPIARPMDDSIVRVVNGREQMLRRARGYAPLPITLDRAMPTILAVGAHLKNTVAVSVGSGVFLSQHVGDLETAEAIAVFEKAARDLPRLYEAAPQAVACDLHPDYWSTRYAEQQDLPITRVQHHLAHVLACMAENNIRTPVIGVAWDGTGLGEDGVIWGGEFFHVRDDAVRRVAHLRPFPLPGGELAMREPRRAALGLLYAWLGEEVFARVNLPILDAFTPTERDVLAMALRRRVNTPGTTSAGRLFDAAAALANVRLYNRYEGQAAMEWEWCAEGDEGPDVYSVLLTSQEDGPCIVDWGPLVTAMVADLTTGIAKQKMSARFHRGLIEAIVEVCRRVNERSVVLTGGCFLNRLLLEGTVRRLTDEGFTPYWHQRVPPGDGGIALGQILGAAASVREK